MPNPAVMGLRALLTRASFKKLQELACRYSTEHKAMLKAVRLLPLLIRRHGLAATLALYWNEGQAKEAEEVGAVGKAKRAVAERFVCLLAEHCAAGFPSGSARAAIDRLLQEPLEAYLLHSRVALVLADIWYELAEPLLPGAREAAQAPAAAVEPAPSTESANA